VTDSTSILTNQYSSASAWLHFHSHNEQFGMRFTFLIILVLFIIISRKTAFVK